MLTYKLVRGESAPSVDDPGDLPLLQLEGLLIEYRKVLDLMTISLDRSSQAVNLSGSLMTGAVITFRLV